MTVQDKAREVLSYFETATRHADGTKFVRTKEDAPEWVGDLVHEAHGRDFLPDDWRYSTIRDALAFIADADDPEDGSGEFADSAVDVYTAARIAWLGSNISRAFYCDDAVSEYGEPVGIIDAIGYGQYREADEVYTLVFQALEELIDE